ncbi:TPR-like protein [Exidia glandulosa HHB12029]|uniref:TPR-like protein n=1 Tax=Exidia glandulosa HHB12029 TaxID=1314781 RepID=A0A165IM16_EXIGL|nr:TPR-like protein [Exidia glandulosa HHB12029]
MPVVVTLFGAKHHLRRSGGHQSHSVTRHVIWALFGWAYLIITCRGADLPPDVEWANRDAVVLSTLSPAAALATFTDIAGNVPAPDQPVRDALLKEVDYMPLAVTLLARLVSRGKQLRDLDRRWNSVHTGMLRTQPNGRLDNVDASVQLSIAYLPSDDPAPLQLLSLCAQLPDGMRLPVRNELEGLCGFRDIDGALDVIQGLALVYVTDDDTIRMLSPIRLYVLEKHRPSAAHRAYLLEIYYEIARHAPRDIDPQFPGARDRILPELSNLDALLLSEIQNFDEPPSTDLIKAVNAVSRFSWHHVPNERLLMALIPRIEHLPTYLAYSLWILADIHWRRNAYDLSLEASTRARSLYQSLRQRSDAADCDQQMGNVHRLKGNYPEAIASLSAARETFYELDRELDVAYCDRELALVFYDQQNYDHAADLFTSTREVFLRLNEPVAAADCQEMLGDIHRMRGDYQAAERQLESALQTYTSLGSIFDIASCSCVLGDVYRSQQRFDAALEHLQVAYDIGQKQGDTLRIANALQFRSYVHRDQGQFALARQLLVDAQRLYESIGDTGDVELCAEGFVELDGDEKVGNM